MEKIDAKKIDKYITKNDSFNNSSNITNENKKNDFISKKGKRAENNNKLFFNKFVCALKSNWKTVLVLLAIFLLGSIVSFLIFSNSDYFMYLRRPKILQNGLLLSLIIFMFLLLSFGNFILEIVLNNEDVKAGIDTLNNSKKLVKNVNNIELNRIKEKSKKLKKYQNNNKITKKNTNFKLYFFILLQILFLDLFFCLHLLWICVFICFCSFFVLFTLLLKSQKAFNKVFTIVLILNFICVLLSFYSIYLIN